MEKHCFKLSDIIRTLNKISDFVDVDTKDHSRHTRKIAERIAIGMGWEGLRLEYLTYGADIHDIGKIAISPVVFRQPSKLTRAQFASVKKHPEFGFEMVQHMNLPQIINDCVLYHHEHYDGTGYHEIAGDAIPECAQIVCIADVWESLISDRPYRRAYTRKEAIEEMNKVIKWFNPTIYVTFLDLINRRHI